ncbi:MAG TPA: hypothetical protein VGV12_07655 [Gemmatimonadales bacterium]|nr:hypothetical protein [Gemmatimonadales bacterium]
MNGGPRERVAFCLDTAHLHAAGYDVVAGIEAVWERFDRELGLAHLQVIKIIETPKGDDPVRHDRRMLKRLRAYARWRGPKATGGRNGRPAQTVGRA